MAGPVHTCLSGEPHNDNIRDVVTHYLGCIEISDRTRFFDSDQPHWKVELGRLVDADIRKQPWASQQSLSPRYARLGVYDPDRRRALEHISRNALHRRIAIMQQRCLDELDRIQARRDVLVNDPDERHLVLQLEESRGIWKSTREFRVGIKLVQQWRLSKGLPIGEVFAWEGRSAPGPRAETEEPDELDDYDGPDVCEARVMLFNAHGMASRESSDLDGYFPHQTIPIRQLLTDSRHLGWDGAYSQQGFRYFHLPSNNMDWVERAMAQYFREPRPDFDAAVRENTDETAKSSYMILQPQFWRGRQASCDGDVAYHMLPLCTTLVSEVQDAETDQVTMNTDNLVVFMPYLHWESRRNHSVISRMIQRENQRHKREKREAGQRAKRRRQERRSMLTSPGTPQTVAPGNGTERLLPPRKSLNETLDAIPYLGVRSPLGRYLLCAARLYEAMSLHQDKVIIRKTLFKSSRLHARVALEQMHSRGFRARMAGDRHHAKPRGTRAARGREQRCRRHGDALAGEEAPRDCEECSEATREMSKLLMVDQLWLWVLDSKTLITAFPMQYGFRKNEPSDVHKAIRTRVHGARPGQIESVFDLGLIVIDECANRVFDRIGWSGSSSEAPPLVEVFTKAISDVRRDQTIALQHILVWSEGAKNKLFAEGKQDILSLNIPFLDIAAETRLQMEINDIVDELEVIIGIVRTQIQILDSYVSLAEERLEDAAAAATPLVDTWFRRSAAEMRLRFQERYDSLVGLRGTAQNVALGMKDVLALKEQQDNLVQAWRAQVESAETVGQGRAIVVFTVVTIIFLPLSFLASVFGMNASELSSDNNLSLVDEFKYMFPISAGASLLAIILAFSHTTRTAAYVAWHGLRRALGNLLAVVGLYKVWLWWQNWVGAESAAGSGGPRGTMREKKKKKEKKHGPQGGASPFREAKARQHSSDGRFGAETGEARLGKTNSTPGLYGIQALPGRGQEQDISRGQRRWRSDGTGGSADLEGG